MTRMSLAERRHKLIAAALTVIREQGLASATTRAIAAEAGMPLASFHYAFESHQALLREAMTTLQESERERLEGLEIHGDSLEALCNGVLEQHLADVVARRDVHLGLLELVDQALRSPELRSLPAEWRAARVTLLADKIDAIHGGAEPGDGARLADALLMVVDGVTMRYLSTDDEQGTRRAMGAWLRQAVLA
ncbi:TetR family transcriptional regulator [Luteococcus sp. H138]|uniref:TetR/AcrR family transcriptional regulator n=1 Tax=unclassified Luteococcus TaxID=2639923 RepID=UPI00313E6594